MIHEHETTKMSDFDSIRLRLASPDDIHEWSFGEIVKPETINYRTQKPERDGLFCEKIFGPTKDWECYCGKYKRIRYKGIVCDKCGVEVTRSIVRRERMGHIDLAAPVSHLWFLRGIPSKIGLVLDMSAQALEKVIYFANFIITKVDEDLRIEALSQIEDESIAKKKSISGDYKNRDNQLQQKFAEVKEGKDKDKTEQELINLTVEKDESLNRLGEAVDLARKELKELKVGQIISESTYQDLSIKYGHIFEAGIGAEAVKKLLTEIDLDKLAKEIEEVMLESGENQARRLIRRLKLVKNLKKNGIRPDWMVLDVIPVIPPDLRPMVPLDGGRYAASDLNDLYRRVINRNNRLKRLKELNAPEVIQRNEKRMLQEAVDALIDNSARHGKTVAASTGQKRTLKSLADMLKGKQGRFRQNLLGKRVDYSGRSVIVVGPKLALDECGLPKIMALELFKPFVIAELIKRELVYNVRSASRYIEAQKKEIWDILEEITDRSHVLLNRAPTLHRLGIQAFRPKLIEGKAIQVHPLVCTAFNADFDGDQMAVHVPLTEDAQKEAREIMSAAKNLLKPATGDPVVTPSQDIVLGCYYVTLMDKEGDSKNIRKFSEPSEAIMAYELGDITISQRIKVKIGKELIETAVGRVLFNEWLPEGHRYVNEVLDKKGVKNLIGDYLNDQGNEKTVLFLDAMKEFAIKHITASGISWGMDDLVISPEKPAIMKKAEEEVDEVTAQYQMGLLTDDERHFKVIEIWTQTKNDVMEASKRALDKEGSVFAMINSGARGSWGQTTQMMGMKGLVVNPAGEMIELPVKASMKEGLEVLEYFISTHGARKGLSDTALRTASAGYLTRRLVDVSQEITVYEDDCKTTDGVFFTKKESEEVGTTLVKRVTGRIAAEDLKIGKKTIVKKNDVITQDFYEQLEKADLDEIKIRSVLTCATKRGVCTKCYGYDLGHNKMVEKGTAVGVIAAQSIGEPGTQLTMRTFHTGGVAGSDITQGLPRVEELFEARPIKKPAVIADVDGTVTEVENRGKQKIIHVECTENFVEEHKLTKTAKLSVADGDNVKTDDLLFTKAKVEVKAVNSGLVKIEGKLLTISGEVDRIKEFPVLVGYSTWVIKGDLITKGQQISEGSVDVHELYELKDRDAVQKYIIAEVQRIYSSQGQPLSDKHIEIVVRQMFSRYYIKDSGDTDLLVGDVLSREQVILANEKAVKDNKKEADVTNLLLGITKASLNTDSWLSAASFMETSRVLIDAAMTGKVDTLKGLKENVIIGKLIPVGTGFKGAKKEKAAKVEKKDKEEVKAKKE